MQERRLTRNVCVHQATMYPTRSSHPLPYPPPLFLPNDFDFLHTHGRAFFFLHRLLLSAPVRAGLAVCLRFVKSPPERIFFDTLSTGSKPILRFVVECEST